MEHESGLPVVRRSPFSSLNAERKLELESRLQRARNNEDYDHVEGVLMDETRKELERRASQGGNAWFLDAGAGRGHGVLAAGRIPGVKAVGLAPAERPHELHGTPHYWINGTFEENVVPAHFGVIQSHCSLMHANNLVLALENLLNSLALGGVLILQKEELEHNRAAYRAKKSPHVSEVYAELERQGFTIKRRSGQPTKIVRGENAADLRQFYHAATLNLFPV